MVDGAQPSFLCLIFMRHGERADCVAKVEGAPQVYESTTAHDPALTAVGLTQADEAGVHFKKRIAEVQRLYGVTFDEILVESSPFLRCLQTASKVAKQL